MNINDVLHAAQEGADDQGPYGTAERTTLGNAAGRGEERAPDAAKFDEIDGEEISSFEKSQGRPANAPSFKYRQ